MLIIVIKINEKDIIIIANWIYILCNTALKGDMSGLIAQYN